MLVCLKILIFFALTAALPPDPFKRVQTDKCELTEGLSMGYTNVGCFRCEQTTKFKGDF